MLVFYGLGSTALAQECVSCWNDRCPELKPHAKRCDAPKRKAPAATPGGAQGAAPRTPVTCRGGKVEVAGHCCWPGQDFGAGTGRCLGEPRCPKGLVQIGEGCELGCEGGLMLVAGHCCWPGQDWASKAGRCVGTPRCPQGQEFRPDGCQPERPMVSMEGGSFKLGGRREVALEAFKLDSTEVTVADFAACVRAGACRPALEPPASMGAGDALRAAPDDACNAGRSDRARHPVNCVDWSQATAYCDWVGARLPTEAEWEWAARGAAAASRFPWGGEEPGGRLCWNGGEVRRLAKGLGTCQVGSYAAGDSPQGLKDLAGNVWEWTSTAEADLKVSRGGAWTISDPPFVSAVVRYERPAGERNATLGFRCARGR